MEFPEFLRINKNNKWPEQPLTYGVMTRVHPEKVKVEICHSPPNFAL